MNSWESNLSPHSPETSDYLMTPSPVMNSSAVPSYLSGYNGGSFDDVLEKSFGDLYPQFSTFDTQSCGVQQTMSIYDGDSSHCLATADTESLYDAFGDRYHQDTHISPTDLDMEFSAFMNCAPQYTAWFWGETTLFDPITRTTHMNKVFPTSHYFCLYYPPNSFRIPYLVTGFPFGIHRLGLVLY